MNAKQVLVKEIWLKNCSSTMEVSKNLTDKSGYYLVGAQNQSRGKGSKGRSWTSSQKNLQFTLALPHSDIAIKNHLFPFITCLAMVNILCKKEGLNYPDIQLKWPNDLLYKNKKAAGILIENSKTHILIGVGMNICSAPPVLDGGRESACLREEGIHYGHRFTLVYKILNQIVKMTSNPTDENKILEEWARFFNWDGEVYLREDLNNPLFPISVKPSGQLLVRDNNGREKLLTSDYLQ